MIQDPAHPRSFLLPQFRPLSSPAGLLVEEIDATVSGVTTRGAAGVSGVLLVLRLALPLLLWNR